MPSPRRWRRGGGPTWPGAPGSAWRPRPPARAPACRAPDQRASAIAEPVDHASRRFDSGGPTLAETGEDRLLRDLLSACAITGPGVMVGPGDDAAVVRPPAGMALALTQDALVEDEDFRREWMGPYLVGRRALVLSLSDLAATGAAPAWCTATVCAPGSTATADVLAIQAGIVDEGVRTGCRLIGGDVSRTSGPLVVDVAAGGWVDPEAVLRRDAGGAGDLLMVTGVLGRAAAGLEVLRGGGAGADAARRWVDAQLRPSARLREGQHAAAAGVRCGGDLSDGLLVDAARTAASSGCGAELWRDHLPVDAELHTAFGARWVDLVLGGGEDFELLLAVPEHAAPALSGGWPAALAPLQTVGRLVPGSGVRLVDRPEGEALPLPAVRSRHFA